MEIKQLLKEIWNYEATDKDISEIKDLEEFKKSYYLQQKFIKEKTGRTIKYWQLTNNIYCDKIARWKNL